MKSREFNKPSREIVVIIHNIRSVLNVGSIFRTAEGFGVSRIFLSGTTLNAENQLPHVRAKMAKELHKTALGAEEIVPHEFAPDVSDLIKKLKQDDFRIVGLEQDERAIPMPDFTQNLTARHSGLDNTRRRVKSESCSDFRDDEVLSFEDPESNNKRVATGDTNSGWILKQSRIGSGTEGFSKDDNLGVRNDNCRYSKIALLLGEEVNGITPELRDMCDDLVEIPMFGRKESFNVSVATGITLYQLTF